MSEMHELAGAYALNALDSAELAEFEDHLATCPICQADVTEFCETAAELSLLSMATPPPELLDGIMAEIQNTPQNPSADSIDRSSHGSTANGTGPAEAARQAVRTGPRRALPQTEVPDEPDEPGTELAPRVDEVALRRQRRRSRVLSGLVAAMLAVAVGLGGGTATFVFSRQLNRALFIGTDLPDPGREKRYQLWTMEGQEPKWKGAERVTRDTQITDREPAVKVFFRGDIAGSDFLCVSIEPKDNLTDTPTVPPVGFTPV